MTLVFFFLLALIPGLLWMRYFYRKDVHDPEPVKWVFVTFSLGALSVLPASFLEGLFQTLWMHIVPTPIWLFHFFNFFFNVGPVEEFFKFSAVFYLVYRSKHFDEPLDGIIYASAAAIGFATAENVLYMFKIGWQVLIFRGFLTTLAHIVFACLWGMSLGQAPYEKPEPAARLIIRGLLMAMCIHGLYDFLLSVSVPGGLIVLLILMGWLWWQIQRWMLWAISVSPHINAEQIFRQLNLTTEHPDPSENLDSGT